MHSSDSGPPRCLHKWEPHDGKPLTSLFFLDDHKQHNPDVQFWKYAVTGANYNTELKLWSCESWTCLQTVKFQPVLDGISDPAFKAAIDLSARYLLLSDIYRKNLYVLHLRESNEAIGVASVSCFATPSAFLSMSIIEARVGVEADDEEVDEIDELLETKSRNAKPKEATIIDMVLVQPKTLQECKIIFDDAIKPAIKDEPRLEEKDKIIPKVH